MNFKKIKLNCNFSNHKMCIKNMDELMAVGLVTENDFSPTSTQNTTHLRK